MMKNTGNHMVGSTATVWMTYVKGEFSDIT